MSKLTKDELANSKYGQFYGNGKTKYDDLCKIRQKTIDSLYNSQR